MKRLLTALSQLCLYSLFCLPQAVGLASQSGAQTEGDLTAVVESNFSNVEHVYGLPDAKAKDKGTLQVNGSDLIFAGKADSSTIPVASIIAVSAGNQRVELWGTKGRILRMAIPDGGGLAAATFMHHQVDMLTVEFSDRSGGYHNAVFFLPANEAQRAARSIEAMPVAHRKPGSNACADGRIELGTVRVLAPMLNGIDTPAAYRALVYEYLIDRLRHAKGVEGVYRDGEVDAQGGCPQFTIQLAITGFKPGSQVMRASTGPVGMFAGTTQMRFDVKVADANGKLNFRDQVKATVRGESESINVADAMAKKLTKQFTEAQKKQQKVADIDRTGRI